MMALTIEKKNGVFFRKKTTAGILSNEQWNSSFKLSLRIFEVFMEPPSLWKKQKHKPGEKAFAEQAWRPAFDPQNT